MDDSSTYMIDCTPASGDDYRQAVERIVLPDGHPTWFMRSYTHSICICQSPDDHPSQLAVTLFLEDRCSLPVPLATIDDALIRVGRYLDGDSHWDSDIEWEFLDSTESSATRRSYSMIIVGCIIAAAVIWLLYLFVL